MTYPHDHDRDSSAWLNPCFLGAYGENDELLEKVLVEFLRDHVYWRRNVHPEDRPLIPMLARHDPEYREFVGRMKSELHGLSAQLKQSVPFFNPRYIGHMVSDLLLPGLIAQLVTVLYNPNNVTGEVSPVTLPMELEVGRQLAEMLGFATDPGGQPCAWGHVTSGGTLANDEALWYFRAVRYWPVAAARALSEAGFDPGEVAGFKSGFPDRPAWELFNLGLDTVVRLRRDVHARIESTLPPAEARRLLRAIEQSRIEAVGEAGFHAVCPELARACVLVPATAHYSWEKALKLLGLGSANLVRVGVDERMRMNPVALDAALAEACRDRRPVLAVIGVLGSTEFGSIDPVDKIVSLRQRWRREGLDFAIHIDAAWGGYLTSIFRSEGGGLLSHARVREGFRHFPSAEVYRAFAAIRHTDSVTVDPHKLGYLPFGCGAFVARNRAVTEFVNQRAAYVFESDDSANSDAGQKRPQHPGANLGQFILEGSKPGAAAAAAWVTHRVMPLDHCHFGRLCSESIRNCEYFFDHIDDLRQRLSGCARVILPFEPDTNLICLAINPEGNRALAAMNRFGRALYKKLGIDRHGDMRTQPFFGSRTLVERAALDNGVAARLTAELGLDPATFTEEVDDPVRQADSIFLLRHTLMNPWLSGRNDGMNYLDRYCRHLADLVRDTVGHAERPVIQVPD